MKATRIVSTAGLVVALALCMAGLWGAAAFVCALSVVVELLTSVITGKQGNETER